MTVVDTDEWREAAAVVTVGRDPVRALVAADRDGLLQYRGAMSEGRYEVEIGGQQLIVSGRDAVLLVRWLRTVGSLRDAGPGVQLLGVEPDGAFKLAVAGRRMVVAAGDVLDWCSGFTAAQRGGPAPEHVGEDQIGRIAELFAKPSLNDQIRMVLLGLMYGRGDDQTVTVHAMPKMIGALPGAGRPPSTKTVLDAFKFGMSLAPSLAEKMIAVFGLRWALGTPAGVVREDGTPVRGPMPEMPGLVRLRRIVDATQAGWVRYRGMSSPNTARRTPAYPLVIGSVEYRVSAKSLCAWLNGVAAYHEVGG